MATVYRWQIYIDGTPNMGSKRFGTKRSELENLVDYVFRLYNELL